MRELEPAGRDRRAELALMDRGRPAEVLLVDDSRGDAVLAQRAFKELPVPTSVTIASTGEIALEILRQQGEYSGKVLPDVILLDLILPQMSGMDVLEAIKTDAKLKHIPVIVMSSSGAGQNILKAYREYANAYLIKPVDMPQYRTAIFMIEKFFFGLATLPATVDD